jgi:hypothetical protein
LKPFGKLKAMVDPMPINRKKMWNIIIANVISSGLDSVGEEQQKIIVLGRIQRTSFITRFLGHMCNSELKKSLLISCTIFIIAFAEK